MEQTERRHGNWKWKQTGNSNCSQKAAEAAGCKITAHDDSIEQREKDRKRPPVKRKSYSAQSERFSKFGCNVSSKLDAPKERKCAQRISRERERERECANVEM